MTWAPLKSGSTAVPGARNSAARERRALWTHPPAAAAAAHSELTDAHPGRFLLGLGVSHQQFVDEEQPGRYSRPLTRIQAYLDALNSEPNPVPREERVLDVVLETDPAGARAIGRRHLSPYPPAPQPHQ